MKTNFLITLSVFLLAGISVSAQTNKPVSPTKPVKPGTVTEINKVPTPPAETNALNEVTVNAVPSTSLDLSITPTVVPTSTVQNGKAIGGNATKKKNIESK